jgi:UDPglucose 6-dehydrogenase
VKIAVIGTGYVGLVTGTCFAETGHRVTCVDVDPKKIALLRGGGIPIYEPGLEELVRRNAKEGRLDFTTSTAEAMKGTDVAFIAVGTPPGEHGDADLSYVLAAAEQIAKAIEPGRYTVVVNKSTVPVGSAEQVAATVRKAAPGVQFDVVSNPEFLKEGAAIDDFMRPDRVVVGVDSERAKAVMAELYAPFVRAEQPVLFMELRSAELTKYAANAMLATRISFMNEVAALCDKLGANVDDVRRGVGSDKRIGHPFLFPGIGFGGSCLAGEETVLVRHAGRARLVRLADLFEALAPGDHLAEVVAPEGLEVLSWRAGEAAPIFLPVAAATRRHHEGEAIEVRTKMGRTVTCTPDHPFVACGPDCATPTVRRADELTPADWLPVARGSATAAARVPHQLDLLAGLDLEGLAPANVILHPGEAAAQGLVAMGVDGVHAAIRHLGHPRGRARSQDILRARALRLDEARAAGIPVEGGDLSTARNGTRVPARIACDERFWYVLGLYLAEGHCTADGDRRRLNWSFHPTRERALADVVAGYWRSLGVKADVRRTGTALSVSISSRILAAALVDGLDLGSDCYSHRIPDLAWTETEANKRALLAGAWHGDGSWSLVNGGPSVVLEWGSASQRLADGVLRLLGDLGIVASLRVGRTARSTVDNFWVRVAGADQVERLLDLVKREDRKGVVTALARQRKRIAPTGYRHGPAGTFVRVLETARRAWRGFVYSLEVPGAETFVTTGGLVVHNCFPKDVRALMTTARHLGLDFDLLRAVERVNERQKRSLVEKATRRFGSLAGKTFGVWGLAFKPKTDDMREAPALTVIEGLVGNGATVKAFDPVAREVAEKLFHGRVELVDEPYAAAAGADALFLLTEWNEFRQPDLDRLASTMKGRVLFDGRNVWDAKKAREKGFEYFGIGRT